MEMLHCWQVKYNLLLLKVIEQLMGIACSNNWYLALDIIEIFASTSSSTVWYSYFIWTGFVRISGLFVFTGTIQRRTAGRLWPRCQWRDWAPAWSCAGGVCTWWGGSTGTTGGTQWSAFNPTPTPGSTWLLWTQFGAASVNILHHLSN